MRKYSNKLKLTETGKMLYDFAISRIEDIINQYNHLRTQVIYPGNENEIYILELSRIFDQLIEEFEIKSPFTDKKSEYFNFMKETALKVLKIKIASDSPEHYIFIYMDNEKNIFFIIRDPLVFGITKIMFAIEKEKNKKILKILKIQHLPSNPYTNPLFQFSI